MNRSLTKISTYIGVFSWVSTAIFLSYIECHYSEVSYDGHVIFPPEIFDILGVIILVGVVSFIGLLIGILALYQASSKIEVKIIIPLVVNSSYCFALLIFLFRERL